MKIIITWKGWTLVRAFKNIQNECKDNIRIVLSNDSLRTKSMKVILKMMISMNYLLNTIKGLSLNEQYIF